MDAIEEYAIITAKHPDIGEIDIRVSRDIPLKAIIHNLFEALGRSPKTLKGYYAKAERSQILLLPGDTFRDKNIFDGEIIRIL